MVARVDYINIYQILIFIIAPGIIRLAVDAVLQNPTMGAHFRGLARVIYIEFIKFVFVKAILFQNKILFVVHRLFIDPQPCAGVFS